MGRAPCCDKSKVRTGPWSAAEDLRLINFIQKHGHSNWRALPREAGLLRCGKSCRLRWINYLRPDVKRGNFTPEEEQTIINLHNSIGNKWSKIASYLPGRTDNEIKNVWNTHFKKRVLTGRKTAVNDSYSASPSCTSSSITTSGDENMENPLSEQGNNQESEVKKPKEKPEFEFLKETTSSEYSPTSSHISSPDYNRPNEAVMEHTKSEATSPEDAGSDYGNVDIPFDSDIDIWELLDSLDSLQSTQSEQNGGNQETSLHFDSGVEYSKWLRFLENELGLTSDGDHRPKDQEMNLEPEIRPGLNNFPIWPCSPHNLGIYNVN